MLRLALPRVVTSRLATFAAMFLAAALAVAFDAEVNGAEDASPQPPTPAALAKSAAGRAVPCISAADLGVTRSTSAAYNRRAYTAAVDALSAAVSPGRGRWRLAVPNHRVLLDRPVYFDSSNVTLAGDGPDSAFKIDGWRDDGCLLLGVSRKPNGVALTPDHWYDLAGRLDSSVKTRKLGLATRGNAHVAQVSGVLAFGDQWWTAPGAALTADALLDGTDATLPRSGALFGLSADGTPAPWLVKLDAGRVSLMVATDEGPGNKPLVWQATTPPLVAPGSPPAAGRRPFRISVQCDPGKGTSAAWVDGIRVPFAMGRAAGTPWRIEGGRRFVANQSTPFMVGALGGNANNTQCDVWSIEGGRSIALGGLLVANAELYADGPDPNQRRTDGKAIDDQRRYFTGDPSTVGYLPLDDDPADVAPDRFVTVQAGPRLGGRRAMAMYLSDEHANVWTTTGGLRVEQVKFGSGWAWSPYGQAVAVGYLGFTDFRDCEFIGGASGLGTLKFGANYPIRVDRCTAYGDDAALHIYYGKWTVNNLYIPAHGRTTLRVDSGQLRLKSAFTGYGGKPKWIGYFGRGSNVTLDEFDVDIEDGAYPTEGFFYAENGPDDQNGGSLILRDIGLGLVKTGRPIVVLRTRGGPPALFSAEKITYVGRPSAIVDRDTLGGWIGEPGLVQPLPKP